MPLFSVLLWSLLLINNQKAVYITHTATPDQIRFFYENNDGPIRRLDKLASLHPSIKFATNASMYHPGYTPVGLYIENGIRISKATVLNDPSVNAGMQPQGVFAITKKGKALIVPLTQRKEAEYKYAVQVSPILVQKGKVNSQLTQSASAKRRSGYGLLKDGRVLFVVSKSRVTFREFAAYFISKGCTEAVFIDGTVSEAWYPGAKAAWWNEFGVLVGAF